MTNLVSIFYSLLGLGGLGFLVWLYYAAQEFFAAKERANELEKKAEAAETKLQGVQDAKAIHERVDHDPAYREHVRDVFR